MVGTVFISLQFPISVCSFIRMLPGGSNLNCNFYETMFNKGKHSKDRRSILTIYFQLSGKI